MTFEFLKKSPFSLSDSKIAWVQKTFADLSEDDKLRQLFNLRTSGDNAEERAKIRAFRPGGVTRSPVADPNQEREILSSMNETAPTPFLVSADLEGSRMSLAGGTEWPNPLALAAIDDPVLTKEISERMAQEARAYGINWSFTPVLDINAAFHSAIVATRGFGSDPATIDRHAMTQMQAFQDNGIASAVKHWPGEGYDDRDQHLVTTINPLSMEDWRARFGQLYKHAIDQGVMSVMSAHIALPAFAEECGVPAGVERYRPASISRHLNQTLLRDELGFNGLIVSDATPMAGLGSWSKRELHLPELISSGCDVILFSDDPERDLEYLERAIADGRLGWDRVNDAIIRQLGLKAVVGLEDPAVYPAVQADPDYALDIARRAPTLVKDVQNLLPLSVAKHQRVLVVSGGINFPFLPDPLPFALPDYLRDAGFDVTIYSPGTKVSAEDFDLVLYLFGDETLLTRGRIFLDWAALTGHFGAAMQRHWHDIPTAMISFGFPYLLYDAPRVPTYINAYSTTETMQKAVVELLLGQYPWNSNSPVDAFCGLDDAKF